MIDFEILMRDEPLMIYLNFYVHCYIVLLQLFLSSATFMYKDKIWTEA